MVVIDAATSARYLEGRKLTVPPQHCVDEALSKDAVARRITKQGALIKDGDLVGVRLNLNVLKSTGVAVHSIHRATNTLGYKANKGFWNGKVLTYAPVVQLRHAYFNVQQSARERIAAGTAYKSPHASVDGELDLVSERRTDGIEVRFNPKDVRFFVDLDNRAVAYAEEVTIIGHRCYARGEIWYYQSIEEAPAKVGSAACAVNWCSR